MFDQFSYSCRVEWGKRGVREAAERGDITVIVDVLSFSSTVVSALQYGAHIYPYPPHLDGKKYADSVGAEFILGRSEAVKLGKPTLSPVTFSSAHSNKKFVLCSLNGAYCTWVGAKVPVLLIGSLLNASAVANKINQMKAKLNKRVTVIACGEQWNDPKEGEDALRPAIEDYLGAGAILSKIEGDRSPEVEVCIGAYESVEHKIHQLIWESGSGSELRQRGFESDVKHCSRLDTTDTVPMLKDGHFIDVTKVDEVV